MLVHYTTIPLEYLNDKENEHGPTISVYQLILTHINCYTEIIRNIILSDVNNVFQ
jgi:hypothetical protein